MADDDADIEFEQAPPPVAPPAEAPSDANALAAPAPEVKAQEFSPTLTVIGKKRERIDVAVNAASNRAQGQLMTSKLRTLLNRTLDELIASPEAPDLKQLHKLACTAETIQTLSIMSYEGKKPLAQGMGSELERLALGAVQAATKGAVQGMADGLSIRDRLTRIRELGKPKEITVEATESSK